METGDTAGDKDGSRICSILFRDGKLILSTAERWWKGRSVGEAHDSLAFVCRLYSALAGGIRVDSGTQSYVPLHLYAGIIFIRYFIADLTHLRIFLLNTTYESPSLSVEDSNQSTGGSGIKREMSVIILSLTNWWRFYWSLINV